MSSSLGSSVWEREAVGEQAMSKNLFSLLICFFTALGIGGFMAAANLTQELKPTWFLFLGAFLVAVLGIFIALGSKNPVISLIGYGLVVAAMGGMTGPLVAQYTTVSVVRVTFVTTSIVLVLGIVGAVIPDSLESWGSYLFSGLLLLIIGLFIVPIAAAFGVPVKGAMTILDWAGVVLFSAYVVYDLNIAMRLERTLDNSIDVALAVFLDWVNLFIRLLELTGERKSGSSE